MKPFNNAIKKNVELFYFYFISSRKSYMYLSYV